MNKTKKLVESLEKNYNIDIMDLLIEYGSLKTIEEMAKYFDISEYKVSTILQHLQLKRPKKKRKACLDEFWAMYNDENLGDFQQALEEENKFLMEKVNKVQRSLEKARMDLNILRHNKRINSKAGRIQEKIEEAFEEALESVTPIKLKVEFKGFCAKPEQEFGLFVQMSDQHIGEFIGPEVPQNNYSYEEAFRRQDYFVDRIVSYPVQSRKLVIGQLGDTLKGIIHGGAITTEKNFIESIIKAVDYYVRTYATLAAVYEEVHVYSVTGNHDRLEEEPVTVNKALDYTRLIDNMVARQLVMMGKTNVKIITTESPYHLVNINGAECIMFHGDTLRKYSADNENQRALLQDICLSMFGKTYKHAFNGHTHKYLSTHNQYGGMSITNGTTVGSNSYGVNAGFRDIPATQTISFINENGDIEFVSPIKLN